MPCPDDERHRTAAHSKRTAPHNRSPQGEFMRLRIRGSGSGALGARGARGGRRTAALATLLALALAAPLSATVTEAAAGGAPKPTASADDIRQYEIHIAHSTPGMRTAIAAS